MFVGVALEWYKKFPGYAERGTRASFDPTSLGMALDCDNKLSGYAGNARACVDAKSVGMTLDWNRFLKSTEGACLDTMLVRKALYSEDRSLKSADGVSGLCQLLRSPRELPVVGKKETPIITTLVPETTFYKMCLIINTHNKPDSSDSTDRKTGGIRKTEKLFKLTD